MFRKLPYALPCLLLLGCADAPDKYRDTHHLELPPILPIEHTNPQPAVAADDMVGKREKPKSALAGLLAFEDDGKKPLLTLKTRIERAWDIVATALQLSDIEVIDKNNDENRFQVRFDADTSGKTIGLLNSFFASDDYPEAEYTITLTDAIAGVKVNAELSKPGDFEAKADGSAQLLRLLHKVIDEKIINRDNQPKVEE